MVGISNTIQQKFIAAFHQNCIQLVCMAHDELLRLGTVNREMIEDTVSMCIYKCINFDSLPAEYCGIHGDVQHMLPKDDYVQNPIPANLLERIDFHYEADCLESGSRTRYQFFMEAKNLYEYNFKKLKNTSKTIAVSYYKRYINTGIDHVLTDYYPSHDTLLLGYVLVGKIAPCVDGINKQLDVLNRTKEHLTPDLTITANNIEMYLSNHPKGILYHLMMKF